MMIWNDTFARTSRVAAGVLAAMTLMGSVSTPARDRQLSEDQRAQIEQRLADVRARLELTPEQSERLQPILRESFEKRLALRESHGLAGDGQQRPSRRQLIALRDDMKKLNAQTNAQVDAVLDDRQMAEFIEIQEETRDQVRQRVREKRR
jgi:hypothetical protein